MLKKLKELHKEGNKIAKEHEKSVKEKISDGSYFDDALDWYFFRYVTAICDRTILIFGGVIAAIVLYFLITMIRGAFPLTVSEPIFMRAKDQSRYFPNLVHIKPKSDEAGYDKNIETVDEAVLKYLVTKYIENREAYDFSSAEIKDVNAKFGRIKNTSSKIEYRKFQLFMSKDNPQSPINDFGLRVKRSVQIQSFKFISKDSEDFASRAIHFVTGKIPTQAEIRFVATKTTTLENEELKIETQPYLVKISFTFDGVKKPKKDQTNIVQFIVNNYQLFKIS